MRAALGCILAGTFLLASCALPALEAPRASRTTAKAPKKSADVDRRDTPDEEEDASAPVTLATPTPTPTPAPTATPKVPMTLFSGLVRVDANYVISAGSGNVISAGSGNVISAGSGNFRLFDTASVPVGTMLPAKGMVVVPISLTTGEPLGEPVRTDETGGYQLEVPKTVTDQVLIFAAFPGENENDPRLHDPNLRYGLIASPQKPELEALDEDSALVTKYALTIFTGRLYELFSQQPDQIDVYLDSQFEGGVLSELDQLSESNPLLNRAAIKGAIKSLYQSAVDVGVPGKPADDRKRITQEVVDALLAKVKISTVTINPLHYDLSGYPAYPDWGTKWDATRADIDTARPGMAYMKALFAFLREKVTAKMAEPTFTPPAFVAGELDRPSDYGDFILREYLATNTPEAELPDLVTVLDAVGARVYTDEASGKQFLTEGLLRAIQVSTLVQLQMQVFLDAAANEAVRKALNEASQP